MNIAIIGGGIAGLAAAKLLYQAHTITLLEKNDYVGGHAHTCLSELLELNET